MHLDSDETILRVIRKHPFYIILQTMVLAALAVLPEIIIWLLNFASRGLGLLTNGSVTFSSIISIDLSAFLFNLWILSLWFIFVYRFTDYYLDKWVITNQRIISVDQRGFFAREVSSVRYDKIQDATVETVGLLATILNFGTIRVQTAGSIPEFVMNLTPKPLLNKEFIIKVKEEFQSQTLGH